MNIKSIFLIACLLAFTLASSQKNDGKKYKFLVFSEECYDNYFNQHNFADMPCFKLTLSKFLGLGIVIFSTILKVPQILKIVRNQSVKGLAFTSLIFETLLYFFTVSYNLFVNSPFSLYGENVFIIFQNIIIMSLFCVYDKDFKLSKLLFTFIFIGAVSAPLLFQLVPKIVFDMSIIISIFMFIMSRFPQIVKNFKENSTGQLAGATFFLNFSGAVARAFTVFTESPNPLVLFQNFLAVIMNGTIFFQIVFIGNKVKKD